MITPVILCGGSGTRLWPLSRKSCPKQFTALAGPDRSLFQAAATRLRGPGIAPPLVVTGPDFRFLATDQLEDAGLADATVLIEPEARDTAPAILAACLWLEDRDPEALMLVMPSDHVIPDADAFAAAVARAEPAARAGRLVTFGILPEHAETGYGWLELSEPATDAPQPLKGFVEKPDAEWAAAMLAAGSYLWNSGIFLFSVRALRAAFAAHQPAMLAAVSASVAGARADLSFHRLDPVPWADVAAISIDYAVMERADSLTVVPFAGHWSDLGGWDAVWREAGPDADGVVTSGPASALDCENTLLYATSQGQEVVGLGLKDTVVVAMPDAVLVADASRAQEVRAAVDTLKVKRAPQADSFPRAHRPWGWFETLALADRFQVKRIVVRPGASLSLQSHVHRSEHWIVVEGTARVTVGNDISLVAENQSAYIPLGAMHRLENPGKVPMVLIEVQTGAYLGEDDITRYDDAYARTSVD
jgi:mannose-1-phosphate guanylyltransferase/mannose-6-phosphate isomerase